VIKFDILQFFANFHKKFYDCFLTKLMYTRTESEIDIYLKFGENEKKKSNATRKSRLI